MDIIYEGVQVQKNHFHEEGSLILLDAVTINWGVIGMTEKTCDNCIEKRKGECWGGEVCKSYKPAPNVSASEIEKWPVIMRSNGQSRRLEWKKQQQKYSHRSSLSAMLAEHDRFEEDRLDALAEKTKSEKRNSKDTLIPFIQKDCWNKIIVWLVVGFTGNNRYKCTYMMEYKGHTKRCDGGIWETADISLLRGMEAAITRITKPQFDVVFVSAESFLELKEKDGRLNFILKRLDNKGTHYELRTHEYGRQAIRDYVLSH